MKGFTRKVFGMFVRIVVGVFGSRQHSFCIFPIIEFVGVLLRITAIPADFHDNLQTLLK